MTRTTSTLLAAVMAVAPLAPVVAPCVAHAAEQAPPSKETLDQIYTDAQIHVERYNSTGDEAQLRTAQQMLGEWLRGHAQLYGYSEQAVSARAPVQQQVAAIEDKLGESSPTPAATAAQPAPPPPTPVSADIAARQRRANTMLNSGFVLGAVGLSSILFVGLPALGLRNNALDNAAAEEFRAEEEKYLRRARRRHTTMIVSMALGGVFTVAGITLVSAGAASKSAINRELSLAPAVGPSFAGGTLRLRF